MLVKFCKPEHNPLNGCPTLRLGTLEFYRSLDPSFMIADDEEGVDKHYVDNFVGYAADKASIDFLKSLGFGSEHQDFYMQNITIRRTFPNCFIWSCMYVEDSSSEVKGDRFDKNYTSSYKIKNPNEFCEFLSDLLIKQFKVSNFSNTSIDQLQSMSLNELSNIKIACYHGRVVYVQKKEGRLSFGGLESYANNIPMEFRHFFVKTGKFVEDCEYRFAFVIYLPQRSLALSVAAAPLDLNCLPFF